MPGLFKICLYFCLLILLMVRNATPCYGGDLVINEFLPNPTSPTNEWVEFYNPDNLDLSTYWLDDDTSFTDDVGSSKIKSLSSLNTDNLNYPYLGFRSFLNNSGDWVVLFSSDGSIVDQYQYTSDPGKDKSIGRSPDGSSNWTVFEISSLGSSNPTISSTPTPTSISSPTPTSSPTHTPTNTPVPMSTPAPSSVSATYRINEVKDEEGRVLSYVKIYVDEIYVHHYAPETLTFCDGCQCDDYVDCGFGEHTIRLEKNGFQDWRETKTIEANDSSEVNPVMKLLSPTSNPTPTPTLSPTPTIRPTPTRQPTKTPTPTLSGGILGATESGEATFSLQPKGGFEEKEAEEKSEEKGKGPSLPWPQVLIGLGSTLMIGASYPLWLPRLKMVYNQIKRDQ